MLAKVLNLRDPFFSPMHREVGSREYLFRQGSPGHTAFLIVDGRIRLIEEKEKGMGSKASRAVPDRTVAVLGPGDILGEKALLNDKPYRRHFSAQAVTQCQLIEFDAKMGKLVQDRIPHFMEKVMLLMAERLDNANELLRILQVRDPADRLIQYLLYYRNFFMKGGASHTWHSPGVALTISDTRQLLNLDLTFVEKCFKELIARQILSPVMDGFLPTGVKELENLGPDLQRHLAPLMAAEAPLADAPSPHPGIRDDSRPGKRSR